MWTGPVSKMDDNVMFMINEMCRKSDAEYEPDDVIWAMQRNQVLLTDEGLYVFNILKDEMWILFAYVKPGVDGRKYSNIVEDIARINHCKQVKFATHREKAFARLYKDYKPAARIFEKEL